MPGLRTLFAPLDFRRATVVALFIALALVFRHLLVLLVFFVAFERMLGFFARLLQAKARLSRPAALVIVLALVLGILVVGGALGFGRAMSAFFAAREMLPERIAAFRETALFARLREHVDMDALVEAARNNAALALGYAAALGHLVLQALLGLILAIVFVLEEAELEAFARSLDPRSLGGTLLRWLTYAAEAVSVTLQFQLVVAACNAVLTLPILIFVGIPHAGAFVFMVFLSGLVPVVGNFISGAVLTLLAYQARGWTGVVLFTVLTFVLHKVESYYLNPRLAARHVRLPGFVLIVSLILWEQLLGFVGLFVSFPLLYLAERIHREFREEDEAVAPQLTRATG